MFKFDKSILLSNENLKKINLNFFNLKDSQKNRHE